MWTSFACVLALGLPLAQNGDLEIVNVRGTYGFLGAQRPPTGVIPGDVFHFAFDIKGMKLDAKGKASYSLLMEVRDEKGELIFKEGPRNAMVQNFLGGDLLPCSAQLEVPLQSKPGPVTLRVTITDRTTNKKAVFEGKGKVLPADFGLVRVGTFADAPGNIPSSPVGVIGQTMYLNFSLINFKRDTKSKQPNVHLALRILDEKGKSTLPENLTGDINENVPEDGKMIPLNFGITLNRVGQFQVELTATDKMSGKSSKVNLPLKVASPN